MKRARRTKIVATLGPASDTPEMIAKLFHAGADVFRLNMSHLPREKLPEKVEIIRTIEREARRPIAILVDLQGPKLRVGAFAEGSAELVNGATFVLDSDPTPGDVDRVYLPHPEILAALEPNHAVLIDDGKLRLHVTEVSDGRAVTRVDVGGRISNRKGVSLPHTVLPVPAMTEKDRSDLEAGLNAGADWIAVSFVQRPEDVAEVKKVCAGRALVMAKIEKPQALTRLDEIIEISDGIMVARGDLGVEMPLEQVPGVQKRITRSARRLGKPVVVATQMLESMITAPVPTRAEVSDVATAVYEGADAVMLSAESAAGDFPIEAISTMSRIAEQVERDVLYWSILTAQRSEPDATVSDAIAAATHQIVEALNLRAVMAWTHSGSTVQRLARSRPNASIIALTPKRETARRLAIVWGTHPIVTKDASDVDDMAFRAAKFALREDFAVIGDRVIVVAGVPFGTPGATNMVRIAYVTREHAALV
ncbi:pyruvate kinase [Methylobacterium haplocladii]|uniref:Pyruvate kinase n=1 Tax=Methylobacterium haplocladii TaxID=1176176 RepID=A0A512IQV3_9HYPH|nr:pyruvate kinase [Methylobacterium haplocladii]GEP00056.1 pyruvate kinase [Methylobacterium haplocladii]GLS59327.1 pyruvate kinase [Methylobacterium haplocladii]